MTKYFLVFLFFVGFAAHAQKQTWQLKINQTLKGINYQTVFKDSIQAVNQVDSVLTELHFKGYFFAQVINQEWVNQQLFVDLDIGKPLIMAYLKSGNIAENVLSEIKFKDKYYKNEPFNIKEINFLKEDLLKFYENNGYPFTKIWVDSFRYENEKLSAQIFAEIGRKITIDTLKIVGEGKVSESFMHSYLNIKNKELYNEQKLTAIDKKINELSLLKIAKPTEIAFVDDKASVVLYLDKQNANQFDGLIGFLPNTATGKVQFIGDFKLKLQNSLKNGESLDFNYRGLPEQSQELNLKLEYPYLFKTQLGLQTSFSFFKQDTNFLNLNTKLALVYSYSANKNIGFFIENFKGNIVADTANAVSRENIADISTQFYGLQTGIESFDDRISPMKGYSLNFSFGVGRRKEKNSLTENISQIKLTANLTYHVRLAKKTVLSLFNQSSYLSGQNLFENEVFRIGGLKSIRGFDEQSFKVKSYSIQTLEFRYFVEKRSYLNLFYDQAIVNQLTKNSNFIDYPFGIGAGFTFQTKIGLLSVNYALGKQQNNPLDLQKGKIHFGIISYF